MPDNTPQNGADLIRTLDRQGGGPETQVMALDIAGPGAGEVVGLAAPDVLPVDSAGLTIGGAYSAGDVLGTEFTFPVCRAAGRGSVITSATLIDKAKVLGAVDLFIFDRPSNPAADNAPNAWAKANIAFLLGVLSFAVPIASANNGVAPSPVGLPLIVKGNGSVNVYGTLVTRIANNGFAVVTDIRVVLGFEPV